MQRFFSFGRLRRTSDKKRGSTAVEFALLIGPFILLFVGIVEFAMILTTQMLLESATYNASRLAKTGYIATNQTQLQTIQAVLNNELQSFGGMIDVTRVTLSSTAYTSFSNAGSNTSGATGFGAQQQIVVYTISYPWTLFTPMMASFIGTNGILTINSQMVVRNEPYG